MPTDKTLFSRLQSANRRRKRIEKALKKSKSRSQASIDHWRDAAQHWQKTAFEYCQRYQALFNTKKLDTLSKDERLKILLDKFRFGGSVFIVRYGTETECKVNNISMSSSTCDGGSFCCDIDLVNIQNNKTHYPIHNINEIYWHG